MSSNRHDRQPPGFSGNIRSPSMQPILGALACVRANCSCHVATRRGRGNTHCPAHDDLDPSLHVRKPADKILLYCHAGCSQEVVLGALRKRGLWPSTSLKCEGRRPSPSLKRYEIRDANRRLLALHCREDRPDGSKRLWWEQPDGTLGLGGLRTEDLPLYGAERLRDLPGGAAVVVTEGEKAADALRSVGIEAVGTVTGASTVPNADVLRPLARFRVYLWPDADPPGQRHMENVAQRLQQLGGVVRFLRWPGAPASGDGADFVEGGSTTEAARALIDAAEPWEPDEEAGAALLEDLAAFVRRYVVLTSEQADGVAL